MKVYIVSNTSGEDTKYYEEIQEVYTHNDHNLDLNVLYKEYELLRNQCRVDLMRVKLLTGYNGTPTHKSIDSKMFSKYGYDNFYDFLLIKGFKRLAFNQIKL